MNVSISGHVFTIPARFAEGHILSQDEAEALNRHFADCIRNIALRWVKAAQDQDGGLSQGTTGNIQQRIEAYARTYRFNSQSLDLSTSTPIETMARQIVLERQPMLIGAALEQAARDPQIRAQAHHRLRASMTLAADMLQALGVE